MRKQQLIGALASNVVQVAMKSGLTWDESVAAFGIAAKVLADGAAKEGDGAADDCHANAKKRLEEGFSQSVRLVFAGSDPTAFDVFSEQEREAVLAKCNTKIFFKMPR